VRKIRIDTQASAAGDTGSGGSSSSTREQNKRRSVTIIKTKKRWGYSLVTVAQLEEAEAGAGRAAAVHITGPDGRVYKKKVAFDTSFRIRLARLGCASKGRKWFNAVEPAGDPSLPIFQEWAASILQRGLIHPDDAEEWRYTFIDVEGGGRGRYLVSATGPHWRTVVSWMTSNHGQSTLKRRSFSSLPVRAPLDATDPATGSRCLHIATFGNLCVRYDLETAFAREWQQKLRGACLAIAVADAWRDRQLELLHSKRYRCEFRDIDPATGAFIPLAKGGRPRKGELPRSIVSNALEGANFFRNLYSLATKKDIDHVTFGRWVEGSEAVPSLTAEQLEPWLSRIGAELIIWQHHGKGAQRVGRAGELLKRIHIGIREGHAYRIDIKGPWQVRYEAKDGECGEAAQWCLDHGVKTLHCYRYLGDGFKGEEEESEDSAGLYTSVDEVEEALTLRTAMKGGDEEKEQWLFNSSEGLRGLAIQLHKRGFTCLLRMSNFSSWSELQFPSIQVSIRSLTDAAACVCVDELSDQDSSNFHRKFHSEFDLLKRKVLDFRLLSQYSPSLKLLLERHWRGPVVGAEGCASIEYGADDFQADINMAHPAAMLAMETVPVFAHFDEVEIYRGGELEDTAIYIVQLKENVALDPFLSADVTPTLGRSLKQYFQLVSAERREDLDITHICRPSQNLTRCHVPGVVQHLLDGSFDGLSPSLARNLKKAMLVMISGLSQQRWRDDINGVLVSDAAEAGAVGGRLVQLFDSDLLEMREDGQLTAPVAEIAAHLCLEWKRFWFKDGFYALALHILDFTRLKVLEVRNALQLCGGYDFAYQVDAVFFKGGISVVERMRQRFPEMIDESEYRVPGTIKFKEAHRYYRNTRAFGPMKLKRSMDELPPGLRRGVVPRVQSVAVIPLSKCVGDKFASLQEAQRAWRALSKERKLDLWDSICAEESPEALEACLRQEAAAKGTVCVAVTATHAGSGKTYVTLRAAVKVFSSGLILTPTNSLRTAFRDLPPGWRVSTYDRQFGFFVSDDLSVAKAAGRVGLPDVQCVILEEAAYVSTRLLSYVLAAAEHRGMSVIATYDCQQLEPVPQCHSLPSKAVDLKERQAILYQVFPTCYHVFARKRDPTHAEQIAMDDALLDILDAADGKDAARRVQERFYQPNNCPAPGAFHLAYTRECARYNSFRELALRGLASPFASTGCSVVAGQYYRFSSDATVHKNHTYRVVDVDAEASLVCIESAFDAGESLPLRKVPLALAVLMFDPPNASTVHAAQGRDIPGQLVVHEIDHYFASKKWLYTAVSRGCGMTNIFVSRCEGVTTCGMTASEKEAWAQEKAEYHGAWDRSNEMESASTAELARALLDAAAHEGARCSLCHCDFVWAKFSESQPTLDRIDNGVGHILCNIDVKCLRCNRERGSRSKRTGRGRK
jgi:hypothetical protein